jgi:hypothetical protein
MRLRLNILPILCTATNVSASCTNDRSRCNLYCQKSLRKADSERQASTMERPFPKREMASDGGRRQRRKSACCGFRYSGQRATLQALQAVRSSDCAELQVKLTHYPPLGSGKVCGRRLRNGQQQPKLSENGRIARLSNFSGGVWQQLPAGRLQISRWSPALARPWMFHP